MKKFIIILCAATLFATQVEARHFGGHHHKAWGGPTIHSHSHHHRGDAIAGFVTGLIGGTLLNAAFNQPSSTTLTTSYTPVVYTNPVVTTPAIVTTPTVVSTPVAQVVPVTMTTQPCYTTTNLVTGAISTHCSSTIISSQVFVSN